MISRRLKMFLEEHQVPYETVPHEASFSSPGTAANSHISGKFFAKSVMVKVDNGMKMCVIPAHKKINIHKLKILFKAKSATICMEKDFRNEFCDCELGAMPPFGNLYDMDVVIDPQLTKDEMIAFNGGTHTELVKLRYKNYEKLVNPKVWDITY